MNENIIKAFSSFFFSLPIAEQCRLYEMFGNELNTVLYEQTKEKIDMKHMDIEKLLNSSSRNIFFNADERLKSMLQANLTKEGHMVKKKPKECFFAQI